MRLEQAIAKIAKLPQLLDEHSISQDAVIDVHIDLTAWANYSVRVLLLDGEEAFKKLGDYNKKIDTDLFQKKRASYQILVDGIDFRGNEAIKELDFNGC